MAEVISAIPLGRKIYIVAYGEYDSYTVHDVLIGPSGLDPEHLVRDEYLPLRSSHTLRKLGYVGVKVVVTPPPGSFYKPMTPFTVEVAHWKEANLGTNGVIHREQSEAPELDAPPTEEQWMKGAIDWLCKEKGFFRVPTTQWDTTEVGSFW